MAKSTHAQHSGEMEAQLQWAGKEKRRVESQLASLKHELLSEWSDGMHVEVVLVEVYVYTATEGVENILSHSSSVTYN